MSDNKIVSLDLHRLRRLRLDAAAVVQAMFPVPSDYGQRIDRRLEVPISRARNGYGNPLFRLAEYVIELWRLGAPRARAELLLVFLQNLIEELWPSSDPGTDYVAAVTRRREIAGRAQVIELRAVRDPAARALWAEVAEEEMAATREAVAAARRVA